MGHDMTALDHKYQRQKRLYRDLLWQHLPKGTSSVLCRFHRAERPLNLAGAPDREISR